MIEKTPFEQLIKFFFGYSFSPLIFLKILYLIALLIYLAFAVIVIRQVNLMIKTLKNKIEFPLKLITWIHLLAVLIIFILALRIL